MGQGTHKRAESRFVVRHHDQDRAGIQAHGPYPGGAAPGKIVGDRRQLLGGEKCSHPIGDPDDQQRVGRPGGGIGGREGGGVSRRRLARPRATSPIASSSGRTTVTALASRVTSRKIGDVSSAPRRLKTSNSGSTAKARGRPRVISRCCEVGPSSITRNRSSPTLVVTATGSASL